MPIGPASRQPAMLGSLGRHHLLCLLGLLGAAFIGISAGAIDLCSFRSPTTDLTRLLLTAHYNYLDLPDTEPHDVSAGRMSLTFSTVHDRPNRAQNVGATAEFSFDRFRFDGAVASAFMTDRYYVAEAEPLFIFGEIRGEGSWASQEPGLEVRFGAGYGRLSDSTPLAKAIRIQDRLLKDLIIDAPMQDDDLRAIAQLIARELDLQGIGALVSEIQQVIEGATRSALDARSLFAIAAEVDAGGAALKCGWVNQLGLGYELAPRFGSSRQFLLNAASDLSRPLSLGSQVEVHGDVSVPLAAKGAYSFVGWIRFDRRLTSSARLVAAYNLQRVKMPSADASTSQSLEFQLLFDLGSASIAASASLTHGTGMSGWIEAFNISTRVDLI